MIYSSRPVLAAIWIISLGLTSHASDWYVDAVNGSDSNSGISPGRAWRTVTHALASVPTSGMQRVMVAPGRYDEALGETFPLRMRDKVQLLGAGAESTELVNTQVPMLGPYEYLFGIVTFRVAWEIGAPNIGPGTVLAGFRITSTRDPNSLIAPPNGVWVAGYSGPCEVELRDLKLDSMSSGLLVEAGKVNLSRLELNRNDWGMQIKSGQCVASEISAIRNFTGILAWGQHSRCGLSLSRSRIEGNLQLGLVAIATHHGPSFPGYINAHVSDCLIARNGRSTAWEGGVLLRADGSDGRVLLERCSIFDNWRGVDALGQVATTIDSCLLQNVDDDLEAWGQLLSVGYSNISDGDLVGINGNISAPALFVSPATGDYRLRFDSPGIDAGNPGTLAGTSDLLGTARSIDGNLDTVERSDIGAFEFAPLFRQGSGRIGTRLKLECWGPPGAIATLQFSRMPLVNHPQITPFGEFDLDPLNFGPFGISAVGQSAPVIFERAIPDSPALIGHVFSFQGLTTSPLAPNGAAYTNGLQFTVLP